MLRPKPSQLIYVSDSPYHKQRRKYQAQTIRCFQMAVDLLGLPASLLDVGCAEGALVGYARGLNVDAVGIDLAVPEVAPAGLVRHDLCEPLDLSRLFECVLCWEVAEHLPESAAETLCDTAVRHMQRPEGRLLFTAARPGQRGPGHVNCQPPIYWALKFEARGLHWQETESLWLRTLWEQVIGAPWYAKNVMVFAWA